MWTTVYVARTDRDGTVVRGWLQPFGFLVSVDTLTEGGCELRVPAIQAEDARMAISMLFSRQPVR